MLLFQGRDGLAGAPAAVKANAVRKDATSKTEDAPILTREVEYNKRFRNLKIM